MGTAFRLKCRKVILSADEKYDLEFLLELTQKDYIRRIFEVVARGISQRVVQITSDCNLTGLETDYDVHYLLKQMLGADQPDQNTMMRHRVTFAEQLQCEQGKLVLNADAILKKRNEVFHLRARTSTLEDVKCTF